jgi:hypothetical protein
MKRLLSFPYIIPSLYTFQQDFKYIKPCATIVQGLFQAPKKRFNGTILEAAEQAFSGVN